MYYFEDPIREVLRRAAQAASDADDNRARKQQQRAMIIITLYGLCACICLGILTSLWMAVKHGTCTPRREQPTYVGTVP